MKGWETVTLESVCTKVTDGTHDTPQLIENGFPLIKGKDISKGCINFESCDHVSEEEHLVIIKRSKPEKGDVLFANIGNSIGDCVYVNTDRPFSIKNVALFKPDHRKIVPRFLYYIASGEKFIGEILAGKSGAAQPFVSLAALRRHPIVIPPLSIQQMIADILAAYDDLIENNLKRIKLLEEMAQITYEEWFVRLRFPGHESTPINSETGLPEGWRMGTMQDLFDFKNGYAFKSGTYVQDGQHKIVTIKNVQDGSFIPDTKDTIAELPSNIKTHHHLSTGDIIMSLTGNVGRVCLVYGENYLLNQRVAKVVPNNPADRLYVYALLRSRGTLTQLENISNGAAQQNLSPVNASKMPALVPTRSVLNDFNKNIGNIIDLICLKNIENNRLREARDILLPRLMTGVIDVESYDPAQLLKEAA